MGRRDTRGPEANPGRLDRPTDKENLTCQRQLVQAGLEQFSSRVAQTADRLLSEIESRKSLAMILETRTELCRQEAKVAEAEFHQAGGWGHLTRAAINNAHIIYDQYLEAYAQSRQAYLDEREQTQCLESPSTYENIPGISPTSHYKIFLLYGVGPIAVDWEHDQGRHHDSCHPQARPATNAFTIDIARQLAVAYPGTSSNYDAQPAITNYVSLTDRPDFDQLQRRGKLSQSGLLIPEQSAVSPATPLSFRTYHPGRLEHDHPALKLVIEKATTYIVIDKHNSKLLAACQTEQTLHQAEFDGLIKALKIRDPYSASRQLAKRLLRA